MSIEDLLAQVTVATYGSEGIRRAQAEASVGDETKIEALREQCETIIGFTEYRYPRYRTSKVHRFIAEQLERVERGEIDRLMLRLPPRHGKSELASRNFPAFCIGRKPWRQDVRRLRGRPDAVQGRAICGRRRASSAWPAGRHRTSDHGVCEGRYSPYPHLDPQRPGTGRCRPGSVADKDAGGLHRAVEPGDGRQADHCRERHCGSGEGIRP